MPPPTQSWRQREKKMVKNRKKTFNYQKISPVAQKEKASHPICHPFCRKEKGHVYQDYAGCRFTDSQTFTRKYHFGKVHLKFLKIAQNKLKICVSEIFIQ